MFYQHPTEFAFSFYLSSSSSTSLTCQTFIQLSQISIETAGSGVDNSIEISVAAIDLLFAMLRTVSTASTAAATTPSSGLNDKGSRGVNRSGLGSLGEGRELNGKGGSNGEGVSLVADELVAERESARDDLWQATWQAVREAVSVRCLTTELALHLCQSLSALYSSSKDAELRYSANIQILLEMVVVLSRPRLQSEEWGDTVTVALEAVTSRPMSSSVVNIQLQRAVMSLLKGIRAVDSLAFLSLVSCLSELCFSCQTVYSPVQLSVRPLKIPLSAPVPSSFPLGPCAEKLRRDAGKYLLDILTASSDDRDKERSRRSSDEVLVTEGDAAFTSSLPVMSKGSALSILDVIVKRFHYDICDSVLAARTGARESGASTSGVLERTSNVSSGTSATAIRGSGSSGRGTWFLSSIGRMLSASSPSDMTSGAITPSKALSQSSPRKQTLSALSHKFQHSHHHRPLISPSHQSPSSSNATSSPNLSSKSSFRGFRSLFDLSFENDLLVCTMEVCLRIADIDNASHSQTSQIQQNKRLYLSAQLQSMATRDMSVSLSLWSSLLSVVACCLSPWIESELLPPNTSSNSLCSSPDGSDPSPIPPYSTSIPIAATTPTSTDAICAMLNVLFAADVVMMSSGRMMKTRKAGGSTVGTIDSR
jgi:hypothetical protein